MPYCSQCAVEVEARHADCPLCGAELQATEPTLDSEYAPEPEAREWQRIRCARRLRLIVLEVASLLLFVPMAVVAATNWLTRDNLEWARWFMLPLGVIWLYVALGLRLWRHPIWLSLGYFVNTALMLLGLDLMADGPPWFVSLGLPLLTTFYVVAVLGWVGNAMLHRSWYNRTAVVLLSGGVYCIGVDLLVKAWLDRPLWPTWSLAVFMCVLAPALFLFYVHYRLSKELDLRKIFHM